MFEWNGKTILTPTALCDAIQTCKLYSDAASLIQAYAKALNNNEEQAKQNIGFLIAECPKSSRKELMDRFETEHPIFGQKLRKQATTKEILEAVATGKVSVDCAVSIFELKKLDSAAKLSAAYELEKQDVIDRTFSESIAASSGGVPATSGGGCVY